MGAFSLIVVINLLNRCAMSPKKSAKGRRSNNTPNIASGSEGDTQKTTNQSSGDTASEANKETAETKNNTELKSDERPSSVATTEDANDAQSQLEKGKKHDAKGAADLERVTDYVEEKEFDSGNQSASGLLSGGIEEAMKALSEKTAKEREEKMAYEKELRKVAINKEHIELIVKEMEISRAEAERCLRQHGGDPVRTLITLTN